MLCRHYSFVKCLNTLNFASKSGFLKLMVLYSILDEHYHQCYIDIIIISILLHIIYIEIHPKRAINFTNFQIFLPEDHSTTNEIIHDLHVIFLHIKA